MMCENENFIMEKWMYRTYPRFYDIHFTTITLELLLAKQVCTVFWAGTECYLLRLLSCDRCRVQIIEHTYNKNIYIHTHIHACVYKFIQVKRYSHTSAHICTRTYDVFNVVVDSELAIYRGVTLLSFVIIVVLLLLALLLFVNRFICTFL